MDQKCARYWPLENEVEELEHFYIRNLGESNIKIEEDETADEIIKSSLELRNGKLDNSYSITLLNPL